MFKYNLGQTVFFMRDNKICSAKITKRSYCDTGSMETLNKSVSYNVSDRNNSSYYEHNLFASVDDISYNLRQNVIAL